MKDENCPLREVMRHWLRMNLFSEAEIALVERTFKSNSKPLELFEALSTKKLYALPALVLIASLHPVFHFPDDESSDAVMRIVADIFTDLEARFVNAKTGEHPDDWIVYEENE